MCTMCVWVPMGPGEGIRYSGTGVLTLLITSGYKQQCGSWKFNLGPLQEKPLLLTTKP